MFLPEQWIGCMTLTWNITWNIARSLTYSRVPKIRTWTSSGTIILFNTVSTLAAPHGSLQLPDSRVISDFLHGDQLALRVSFPSREASVCNHLSSLCLCRAWQYLTDQSKSYAEAQCQCERDYTKQEYREAWFFRGHYCNHNHDQNVLSDKLCTSSSNVQNYERGSIVNSTKCLLIQEMIVPLKYKWE